MLSVSIIYAKLVATVEGCATTTSATALLEDEQSVTKGLQVCSLKPWCSTASFDHKGKVPVQRWLQSRCHHSAVENLANHPLDKITAQRSLPLQ
jgi:hypothetical protein